MNGYHLFLFIFAIVTGVPALAFWRITTITGRMDEGDFGAEPEENFG